MSVAFNGKATETKTLSFTIITVKDANGNAVTAQVSTTVTTSDSSIVAVAYDSTTRTAQLTFGKTGTATITATHNVVGRNVSKAVSRQVTVSASDPASIEGGEILIDGM